MLTQCNSVHEISKERFLSKKDKVIPSFSFEAVVLDIAVRAVVVLPAYGIYGVRVLLELLDGLRLNLDDPVSCRAAFDGMLASNTLYVRVGLYEDVLAQISHVRQQSNGFLVPDISLDELEGISRFITAAGGGLFLSDYSEWVDYSRPLDMLDSLDWGINPDDALRQLTEMMFKPNLFTSSLQALSAKFDVCSVGTYVVYPEDIYATPEISLRYMNHYTNNLYSSYQLLRDVLQREASAEQLVLFKQTRCRCGGDLVLRLSGDKDGYSTLQCINPYCKHKMLWGFAELVSGLGIKGVGAKTFSGAVENIWLTRVLESGRSEIRYSDLLSDDFAALFEGSARELYFDFKEALSLYSESTKELVKKSGLPFIGEYASEVITKKLLSEPIEFMDFVRTCQLAKVKDLRLAFQLYLYLDDLKEIIVRSRCDDMDDMIEFRVCITRSVLLQQPDGLPPVAFPNKENFIFHVNEFLKTCGTGSAMRVIYQKHLSSKCNVLINDSGLESTKTRNARTLGIPIVRSCDLINTLKEVNQ